MATSVKKRVSPAEKNRHLILRSDSLFARTEVGHRPRDQSLLHFDILGVSTPKNSMKCVVNWIPLSENRNFVIANLGTAGK